MVAETNWVNRLWRHQWADAIDFLWPLPGMGWLSLQDLREPWEREQWDSGRVRVEHWWCWHMFTWFVNMVLCSLFAVHFPVITCQWVLLCIIHDFPNPQFHLDSDFKSTIWFSLRMKQFFQHWLLWCCRSKAFGLVSINRSLLLCPHNCRHQFPTLLRVRQVQIIFTKNNNSRVHGILTEFFSLPWVKPFHNKIKDLWYYQFCRAQFFSLK